MHVKIQTSLKSGGNKGTSAQLLSYMEKKEREEERRALQKGQLPPEKTGFFNHERDKIYKHEAIEAIDNNKLSLSKETAKYYSVTLSPSEKEQQYILKKITGKEIKNIDELSSSEKKEFEGTLKNYTRNAMDVYAGNFKRDYPKSGNDLMYYAKIEHEREYKGTDQEVKDGKAKSGELKPGLNSHVHIIVSRKDRENKVKLSPLAAERGHKNKSKANGKAVYRGFDRDLYKLRCQSTFDKDFQYKRDIGERVEYLIQNKKEHSSKSNIRINQEKQIERFYDDKDRKSVPEYQSEKNYYQEQGKQQEKEREDNNNQKEMEL